MHFLNVVETYWHNPDLNNIQIFGKDIRTLLALSSQKLFYDEGQSYYYYGPFEFPSYRQRGELDLAVASSPGHTAAGVSREKRSGKNHLILTDRVYEHGYLRRLVAGLFERAKGVRLKADNAVLNLGLLSLMLDLGLFEQYSGLLNLPFVQRLQHANDTRQLQVEVGVNGAPQARPREKVQKSMRNTAKLRRAAGAAPKI